MIEVANKSCHIPFRVILKLDIILHNVELDSSF